MTELETRLTAALHDDTPPARDAMFRVQVLERFEEARFKRHVSRTVVVSFLLGLVAAVNASLLEGWFAAAGQDIRIIAFAAAATTCVVPALLIRSRMTTVLRGVGRWWYP